MRRVEDVISPRIGAGCQPTGRALAEEFRHMESSRRSIDNVPFLADQWVIDALDCPAELSSHDGPELGEVGVHVSAIAGRVLGIIALVSVDEISADAVLPLGGLAPGALALMGSLQLFDIDVDALLGRVARIVGI